MQLSRISVARPVFIVMVILGLVLLGGISFRNLNQELFPSINAPVVSISTVYSGASPEDVEQLVTKPIEDAVSGLSNVESIAATSSEGRSTVIVTFNDRANTDLAAVDVERRISAIRSQLPSDAGAPAVFKFDFTAIPSLFVALSGDIAIEDLFDLADREIRPRLQALDGVGQVSIGGGVAREVQVRVDPNALSSFNLTVEQVAAALQQKNVSRPSGTIEAGDQLIAVRLSALLQSTNEIANLVVSTAPGAPIAVRDVATVVESTRPAASFARVNGKTGVSLAITKVASANEIRTADNVRAELERLQRTLPAGVTLSIVSDNSTSTRSSLVGVQRSLIEAIIITAVILLLFLHTLRSTVIVLFAIPTSLISTFLWMNMLGFTLNLMSMLALVLVIGVLVDDSIVVIENIVRHLQMGETPIQAALNGRSEIGLAAIAITLVDVIIFLPVGFLSGITGGFFRQFGLVIVAATLTSLFISFTLTPMLASRWLNTNTFRVTGGPWGAFTRGWEAGFLGLERFYERVLRWTLRWRIVPPILAVLSLVVAFALVPLGFVKFEFVPQSDNGIFSISTQLPAGSSLGATDRLITKIEQQLATIPEVKTALASGGSAGIVNANSGPRFGSITVVLVDVHERKRSVFQVMADLAPKIEGLDGAVVQVTSAGFGGSQPIALRVQSQSQTDLRQVAAQVEAIVRRTPGATAVTNSAVIGSPETRLTVDRERLTDFGLTPDQVANLLRIAIDGTVVSKLRPTNAIERDIRLIAIPATRQSVENLQQVPVTVIRDGQPIRVRLGQVTDIQQVAGPSSLSRFNRVPQATIGASLVGTTPLNDVTGPIGRELAVLRQSLPPGTTISQGGQADSQAQAFGQLLFALGLSIVLIYMLLAALYESYILPFATMFSLPVALVGALGGLAVSGNTLNLFSAIGFIVLMGLVGKNGILLVDYTNTLRQRGRSRTEALLEAGPTRLRPILMTTAALCFGLLPIAAKLEEGSAFYASIGALIIGGMLTSTLLSLIVVPSMYTYFDDFQQLIVATWNWRPFRRGPRSGGGTPQTAEPTAVPSAS